jgi:nucleotide-binding universal stress UspA family protein
MSTTAAALKRILVPHDFSDTAERALSFALDLAERLGAGVIVLHAYDAPVLGFPDGTAALPALVELTGQIQSAAAAALEGVARRVRSRGVPLDTVLRQGPAWSEIDAAARELGADLIVMGTHGRRGVSRALMGSVAEKVVRTAPCPVLTVHGPLGDEAVSRRDFIGQGSRAR